MLWQYNGLPPDPSIEINELRINVRKNHDPTWFPDFMTAYKNGTLTLYDLLDKLADKLWRRNLVMPAYMSYRRALKWAVNGVGLLAFFLRRDFFLFC